MTTSVSAFMLQQRFDIDYIGDEEPEDCVPGTNPENCQEDPIEDTEEEPLIIEPVKKVKIRKCDFDAEDTSCRLPVWKVNRNIYVNGDSHRVLYRSSWNENIFYVDNSMYQLERKGAYNAAEFEIDGRTFEFRRSNSKISIREI